MVFPHRGVIGVDHSHVHLSHSNLHCNQHAFLAPDIGKILFSAFQYLHITLN